MCIILGNTGVLNTLPNCSMGPMSESEYGTRSRSGGGGSDYIHDILVASSSSSSSL